QYSRGLSLTYQASNWVSSVTDWTNRSLTFTYSGTPQRLTSIADNTSPARSVSYGYSTAYSPQGDLTSFTDAESKTSTFLNETNQMIFDGNHNPIYLIDPLGFTNQNVFDSAFNLIRVIDALGDTNNFGFNSKFQLIGVTNAMGDWVTFGFNSSDGTLASKTD